MSNHIDVSKGTGKFVQLTDVHFNPFYDSTLFEELKNSGAEQWEAIFATSKITGVGTYDNFKMETDFPLLNSTIQNMAGVSGELDFILFTGDFLAHIFHTRYKEVNNNSEVGLDTFIDKTLQLYAILFEKNFPGVPVYFCLGNNDSYAGDYLIEPGGAFLKSTSKILGPLLSQEQADLESFYVTYPVGGYYAITPRGNPGRRIISLNSILFSPKHTDTFPKLNAAQTQLKWFEEQLKAAEQEQSKVWLLLHIPPGADVYGCLKKKTFVNDWETEYCTSFIALLEKYAGVIEAGFAGHTHMDDFRLLQQETGEQPEAVPFVHIGPGISSLFGNNPGFELFTFDRESFTLKDYEVHYLNLAKIPSGGTTSPQWEKEYNFSIAYDQPDITPASLQKVFSQISGGGRARDFYMKAYDVNRGETVTPENVYGYCCGISRWTKEGFLKCSGLDSTKKEKE
ncbi:MAG: hypothetical protein GY757_48215 [bacterium]|nr:hypothetical protein [bacterium]